MPGTAPFCGFVATQVLSSTNYEEFERATQAFPIFSFLPRDDYFTIYRLVSKEQLPPAFFNGFSLKAYSNLSEFGKSLHSAKQCRGCLNVTTYKNLLPLQLSTERATKEELARSLYESASRKFNETFPHENLLDILNKVMGQNTPKTACVQNKQKVRQAKRKLLQESKAVLESTSTMALFGSNMSFGEFKRNRMTMYHETIEEAQQRKKSQRPHVPNLTNIVAIDEDHLMAVVRQVVETNGKINCFALGKLHMRYSPSYEVNPGGMPGNPGQTLRHYLEKIHQIEKKHFTNRPRVRRALQLLDPNDPSLKVAAPPPVVKVKEKMMEKIENEEVCVGIEVVQKTFSKVFAKADGTLITKEFSVTSRLVPLVNIIQRRIDELNKLRLLRLHSDDEIHTLFIAVFGDNATVESKSHVLYSINILFEPINFLTSREYKEKTGLDVDIAATVERPELYIFGLCTSSTSDLLCFSEVRRNDLLSLNGAVFHAGEMTFDIKLKLHKADLPQQSLESGCQKGGDYCCPCCGANAKEFFKLEEVFREPYRNVHSVLTKVRAGSFGHLMVKGNLNPTESLSKTDLVKEVRRRGLEVGSITNMRAALKKEMAGIQRSPALIYPLTEIPEFIDLSIYEITAFECLHALKEHIKNILLELPLHLPDETAKNNILTLRTSFYERHPAMRGCDMRELLVQATNVMKKEAEREPTIHMYFELLFTLMEISEICYLSEEDRSPQLILRFYNLTYKHALLMKKHLSRPVELTIRKLFGAYFHGLTVEAPRQLRVMAGTSFNTEDEERTFRDIKQTTRSSNHTTEYTVKNAIIRLQSGNLNKHLILKKSSGLSESNLIPSKDTTFTSSEMKHPSWQAHLERISDYLVLGEGVWWDRSALGVTFKDKQPNENEYPVLRTFTTSTIVIEEQILKKTWDKCANMCKDKTLVLPLIQLCDDPDLEPAQQEHYETGFLDSADAYDDDNDDDDDDVPLTLLQVA